MIECRHSEAARECTWDLQRQMYLPLHRIPTRPQINSIHWHDQIRAQERITNFHFLFKMWIIRQNQVSFETSSLQRFYHNLWAKATTGSSHKLKTVNIFTSSEHYTQLLLLSKFCLQISVPSTTTLWINLKTYMNHFITTLCSVHRENNKENNILQTLHWIRVHTFGLLFATNLWTEQQTFV